MPAPVTGEGAIAEPERDDYPPGCYQIRREPAEQPTLAEKQNRILKRISKTEDNVATMGKPADQQNEIPPYPTTKKKVIITNRKADTKNTLSRIEGTPQKRSLATRHTLATRERISKKDTPHQKGQNT